MTHEANPFRAQTLVIVETHPLDAVAPADVQAISLVSDQADFSAKPKLGEIAAVLAALPAESIELFEVDYNSKLQALPDLRRFVNLRYIQIGGRKIREVGDLSSFRRLESLYLANPKVTRLSTLKLGPLNHLRLIRGRVEVIDVFVNGWALLQNCTHLRLFERSQVPHLTLESCRHTQLSSLGDVGGLSVLDLISPGRIDDFDFLARCRQLLSLTVTATGLSSADFSGFGECPSLRRSFLPISRSHLGRVAAEYPSVLFGNGNVSFKGNEELPGTAYYNIALD